MSTAYSWCEFEKSQALQQATGIHFTKSTLLDGLDGTILLLLEVAWLPRPPYGAMATSRVKKRGRWEDDVLLSLDVNS